MVVAIGHAFGVRTAPSLGFCAGVRDDGAMQFSMPVTAGAVGGGVFDMSGQLLAVITGGLGPDNRVTTAIPAYRVAASVDYLRRHGDRPSGFLSITTREIEIYPGLRFTSPARLASAQPQQDLIVERGILVTGVVPGSPAARARIHVGDLIYAVDDIFVNSAAGMAAMVQQSPPGRVLDLGFIRDNRPMSLQTVISAKTAASWAGSAASSEEAGMRRTIDSLKQVLNSVQNQIERLELNLDRL
jgi:S1-C subfamily serine protease